MEGDFPPLPVHRTELAQLAEMFPGVEKAVVELVLEGVQGEVGAATSLLLSMGGSLGESLGESRKVEQEEVTGSLAWVAATVLDSPRRQSAASGQARAPGSTSSTSSSQARPPGSSSSTSSSSLSSSSSLGSLPPGPGQDLAQGCRVMVLLRGLPGSGKSTLANRLISSCGLGEVFSTDSFFLDSAGRYRFNPGLLGEAHSRNQARVAEAVGRGERLVVVDNTNTCSWEMKPYITLAVNNGYIVHILEPDTQWKFKPRQLAAKNSHNVPIHKIKEMLERYERDLDLQQLLCRWSLTTIPESNPDKEIQSLVDYSSDEEEIFLSDAEEEVDIEEPVDGASSSLNPDVPEFVPLSSRESSPLTVQEQETGWDQGMGGLQQEQDQELGLLQEQDQVLGLLQEQDQIQGLGGLLQELRLEAGLEGPPPPGEVPPPAPEPEPQPDITQLLSMFPHLSLGQLETLYMVHQGNTTSVVMALLEEQDNTLDLRPPTLTYSSRVTTSEDPDPGPAPSSVASSPEPSTVSMTLDPMFAVALQELYGSPVEEERLQLLNTEELLEVRIPTSLALQIFSSWRRDLKLKLQQLPVRPAAVSGRPAASPVEPGGPVRTVLGPVEPGGPVRTVLAPNAVEYYEGRMVSQAVEASLHTQARPRTQVVVVATPRLEESRARVDEGLESFIQQRDELYRKARASSKIQGVAGFYASEARELNNHIKAKQREAQMHLFLAANQGTPGNRLDLHYLQTGEALKQLSEFISERQVRLKKGQVESVEVVTGKGNRSDNGRSRLRPAVQNWLDQKKYPYSEVNSGCLKVQLKNS